MSLQKIVLPDFLITELYKRIHLIVDSEVLESAPEVPEFKRGNLKFLGNNVKKVTIMVQYSEDVFLPEKHMEFLIRILGACKLNIGDVAIVNGGSKPIDINDLIQQLEPEKMLLFGIEPTELRLPLSFPQFKLQEYARCTYLYVPSLDNLNSETEEGKLLKTKLWICLRTMFDVSSSKQ